MRAQSPAKLDFKPQAAKPPLKPRVGKQPAYAPYAATKGAVEAIGLNRAALPHLRRQGHGLLLWVGSTSTRVGTPPYLAPYFAAMDSFVLWDDPVRTPR